MPAIELIVDGDTYHAVRRLRALGFSFNMSAAAREGMGKALSAYVQAHREHIITVYLETALRTHIGASNHAGERMDRSGAREQLAAEIEEVMGVLQMQLGIRASKAELLRRLKYVAARLPVQLHPAETEDVDAILNAEVKP